MAAFNFPNSPSVNDIHSENGVSFKWNGSMWNRFGPAYTDTANLNVTGIGTIAGNFHVGGVLTYEDVKNVDSVGIVTARQGVRITGGGLNVVGVSTFNNDITVYGTEGADAFIYLSGDEGDDDADKWRFVAYPSTSKFLLQNKGSGSWKTNIQALGGVAGVTLLYNNNDKLVTTNTGINVTGVVVDDGATHDGDVSFSGASYAMTWRKSGSALRLDDNTQLNFGTQDDGDIYHDGSQMIINNATGTLKVRSNNLQLTRTDNEVHVNCVSGAQVELYNSGNKRLETTSSAIKVTATGPTLIEGTSNANLLSLRNTTGGNGTVGMLFSTNATAGREKAAIFHKETHGTAHYKGDFIFCLNSASGGAGQVSASDERMRITSAGLIFTGGVSTQPSGDNRTLNLCSTSTTEAGISFSRSSSTMGGGTTSGQTIRLMSDGALTFNVHNVGEKVRMNQHGDMGVGVVPSSWKTGGDFRALQVGSGVAVVGRGSGNEDRGGISVNHYHNTSDSARYIANGHANYLYMNDGYYNFRTAASGSANGAISWATPLQIDPSGYIHRNSMPVFHAQSSPSRDGSGFIHSFGSVHSNIGSHYNNGNGKFTAPVNGFYFFGFTVWCNDSNANDSSGTLAVVTIRNSSDTYQRDAAAFNVMPGDGASYSLSASGSGVVYMAATNHARLSTQFSLRGSQPRNMFSGFLLHAT